MSCQTKQFTFGLSPTKVRQLEVYDHDNMRNNIQQIMINKV
ncbi:hypothetical protein BpHYR1_041688 [Brachionus plicatilis]|uniref:Uncharacterized protein n=1 Tax=Brachionus plicatilis TaxID=10195 RepID=A0A3M7Q1Z1_BRAPC|nr:hypothetical protein BpHYR1_041688 [Brachionus plicatilis]